MAAQNLIARLRRARYAQSPRGRKHTDPISPGDLIRALSLVVPVFLGVAPALAQPQAPDKVPVLLLTGANNHDWEWSAPELKRVLEESGRFELEGPEPAMIWLATPERLEMIALELGPGAPSSIEV